MFSYFLMYYHFNFRIQIAETSISVMLESKQHPQWTSLQYLQVPHDCTCSDFVANSYGESWDSSCEQILSPSPDWAF